VSELATNAVTHASSDFTVTVTRNGATVHIAVRDHGAGVPVKREATPQDRRGRGLMLLDHLSAQWGVRDRPGGKEVWFELGGAAG
jgi:anti-sigma regulatory factor (Ser/Thr protein kinase)